MESCGSLTPDFIRFLFSSKPKFDCYFKVGNETQGKPERIGGVKLMLMAHSEVFRAELEYEKSDVSIEDVHPDTFRGMLRYVYGNDTIADMGFDDADNLLYVAEKYMMKTLKDKLATRLMKLLNTDNICSLLNNPACHRHLQLDSAITDILRYETDHVLASPQFVWMNADGFLRILEQDGLAVPEIELWRAAIRWAKHRANSEDGQQVRQQLSGLTRHLRPCALTEDEISREIADTQVLTVEEEGIICQSVARKEKPNNLKYFSSENKPRKLMRRVKINGELLLKNLNQSGYECYMKYNFTLHTKKKRIELLPLVCKAKDPDRFTPEHEPFYRVNCTTVITQVTNQPDPDSSSAFKQRAVARFCESVEYGVEFEIPLAVDGNNITLQPGTEYRVKMVLDGWHKQYYQRGSNDHLTLLGHRVRGSGTFGEDRLTLGHRVRGSGTFGEDRLTLGRRDRGSGTFEEDHLTLGRRDRGSGTFGEDHLTLGRRDRGSGTFGEDRLTLGRLDRGSGTFEEDHLTLGRRDRGSGTFGEDRLTLGRLDRGSGTFEEDHLTLGRRDRGSGTFEEDHLTLGRRDRGSGTFGEDRLTLGRHDRGSGTFGEDRLTLGRHDRGSGTFEEDHLTLGRRDRGSGTFGEDLLTLGRRFGGSGTFGEDRLTLGRRDRGSGTFGEDHLTLGRHDRGSGTFGEDRLTLGRHDRGSGTFGEGHLTLGRHDRGSGTFGEDRLTLGRRDRGSGTFGEDLLTLGRRFGGSGNYGDDRLTLNLPNCNSNGLYLYKFPSTKLQYRAVQLRRSTTEVGVNRN